MLLTPKKWQPPTPPTSRVPVKLFLAAAIIALGLGWLASYLKSANQIAPTKPAGPVAPPAVEPAVPNIPVPFPPDPVKPPVAVPVTQSGDDISEVVPPIIPHGFWDGTVVPGDAAAVEAVLRKELATYDDFPKELQPLLKEENLAIKLVAAIDLVAGGELPVNLLQSIKLPGAFKATKDPRSGWVMAVENAVRSVKLVDWLGKQESLKLAGSYHRLEPGLEAVYRSEFAPEGGFRQRFHQAMLKMTATPPVPPVLPLKPQGAQYLHGDPGREGLPPIQKLIIRSGKTNTDHLCQKLNEVMKAISTQP